MSQASDGAMSGAGREARRSPRQRVIRRVQLVAGSQVVDGVLDVSQHGARIQATQATYMPPLFLLRQPDGTAVQVARRWSQDRTLGVEFLDAPAQQQPVIARGELDQVRDNLRRVHDTLLILGRSSHFGDEDTRSAARDLGAAADRLQRALDRLGRKVIDH